MNPLDALPVQRLSGAEAFTLRGIPTGSELLSFWRWSCSDLVGNALRGVLAEYIVAMAIGRGDDVRTEWDAFDLCAADGTKIEVKSAAYLQSWAQEKMSAIQFSIAETFGWDASTNTTSTEKSRQADVYVFCLLKHQDKASVNPLELDQWTFYCLATAALNQQLGRQKTISLSSLLTLNPIEASFEHLPRAIQSALE